jgi:transposase
MANILNMAKKESILALHAQGWSQRRIALELSIDRSTVARTLQTLQPQPKPASAPTGCEGSKPATFSTSPGLESKPATYLEVPTDSQAVVETNPKKSSQAINPALATVTSTADKSASKPAPQRSQCQPYHVAITAKLQEGLSLTRIHQDLASDGIDVDYDSLRRYVRRIGHVRPQPFRRMECASGEEAQVDFGSGAPIILPNGKRKKTNVFRIVLSHSRKGYSEATFTQTTEDFFRCLENAFAHFGGVPKTLVIDNLKAAVKHPDWYDPELTPKVQSFCQHYGTVILPTKSYTPRHKGKVEGGVKYVKNNGLKGRTFQSLDEQNQHLAQWEANIADTRIHGTTKQQVGKLFHDIEKSCLQPLRLDRFPEFREARRMVNRDGHVEVGKAYYSAPPEYLGREVWARWDARTVRIFNHRWEQIAMHVRSEPGRFNTRGEHLVKEKISGIEKGANYLLNKVRHIGSQSHEWAQAMLNARGIEGVRVLQGLLALSKRHSSESLEKACKSALSHGCYRLRTIRALLKRCDAPDQPPLPFLDEHPIIRPMSDYAAVVQRAIHRQDSRSSMSEGFSRPGGTMIPPSSQQKSSADLSRQSFAVSPPRDNDPLSGCASAEPDSVSLSNTSVVPDDTFPTS